MLNKGESLFLKNAAWLMLLQAVNVILPFVTVPYVTRVFGTELYGAFSLALNWITYVQVVVEYGFNLSATRRIAVSKNEDEMKRLLSDVVAVRCVLLFAGLAVLLAFCLIRGIDQTQFWCLLMLFPMQLGIALQLNWLFQGLQDMKVITLATSLARFASVALVFLFVTSSSQLMLYAFFYSCTFMLSAAITHYVAWKKYHLRLGKPSLKGMCEAAMDGWSIFVSSASGRVIGSIGTTVLGAVASLSTVGAYAAVMKLTQLVSLMFSPISQALYPKSSRDCMVSAKEGLRTVSRVGIPVCTFFGLLLASITILRVPVITLLFGEDYLLCENVVLPLAIWTFLGILNNFLGIQLLIPLGFQRIYGILMTVSILFALVFNVFLGQAFGAFGIALASAIVEAFLTASLVISLLRILSKLDTSG